MREGGREGEREGERERERESNILVTIFPAALRAKTTIKPTTNRRAPGSRAKRRGRFQKRRPRVYGQLSLLALVNPTWCGAVEERRVRCSSTLNLLHPTPFTCGCGLGLRCSTLHPTPYTLPPTTSTLHPAPCNRHLWLRVCLAPQHPTPYTRQPTPYTLAPDP